MRAEVTGRLRLDFAAIERPIGMPIFMQRSRTSQISQRSDGDQHLVRNHLFDNGISIPTTYQSPPVNSRVDPEKTLGSCSGDPRPTPNAIHRDVRSRKARGTPLRPQVAPRLRGEALSGPACGVRLGEDPAECECGRHGRLFAVSGSWRKIVIHQITSRGAGNPRERLRLAAFDRILRL